MTTAHKQAIKDEAAAEKRYAASAPVEEVAVTSTSKAKMKMSAEVKKYLDEHPNIVIYSNPSHP